MTIALSPSKTALIDAEKDHEIAPGKKHGPFEVVFHHYPQHYAKKHWCGDSLHIAMPNPMIVNANTIIRSKALLLTE